MVRSQLLEAIKPLQRGVAAAAEDQQRIEELTRALERQNPNKASLAAPEINGAPPSPFSIPEAVSVSLRQELLAMSCADCDAGY